jgi:hypothetical protein
LAEPPTLTRGRQLAALLFIGATVALWIGLRAGFGIGWGALDRAEGPASPLGLAHGVLDNLSYAAWAQQAKDGLVPFAILQTTEPHDAIFVAPYLAAAGGLARIFGLHPLLVLNLAALGLGAATLHLLFRVALAAGLGYRAGFLAMAFAAYGSGLSVVLRLLLGEADWAHGADATYLDLFPSAALAWFPYHAAGLAAMAALLLALIRAEARPSAGRIAAVFASAVLAAAVRPYAPAVLTLLYAALTPLSPARRAVRLKLLAALLLGVGPLALYYAWVARQPVWAEFAAQSLSLGYDRLDWLIGFGLFWPAAAAGALLAFRRRQRTLDLPVLWAGFVVALLVLFNSAESKLADAGFLALALLAGVSVDSALTAMRAWPAWSRTPATLALGLAILASCLGSAALFAQGRGEDWRPLDAELVRAAEAVRREHPGGRPAVLTEVYAGALLPALAGLRVHAGHWSLTLEPRRKLAELAAAGFEPGARGDAASRRAALDALLAATRFDYVLVRKDRPATPLIAATPGLSPAWQGERWLLFRVASN